MLLRSQNQRARLVWVYSVLVPLLAIFVLFNVAPVLKLVDLSLHGWSDVLAGRDTPWTLKNYARLVGDPTFWTVLNNTLVFTLVRVPLTMLIGLVVAVGIQRTRLLRGLYVAAWFSPFMTSVVAMALVFTYFYNPTYGLFDFLLAQARLPAQTFLVNPGQALGSILVVDLWKNVGFTVVIFMAGLAAIPTEYYDAAVVDGANAWRSFRYITWPMLSRTTYLVLMVSVISSMRVFVPIYMMTGFSLSAGGLGGPLNSTNVLTLYMYQAAFRFNDFGYAATIATVLFLLVMAVTLLQLRVLRVSWDY